MEKIVFITEVNEFGGAEITFVKFIKEFVLNYKDNFKFYFIVPSKNRRLKKLIATELMIIPEIQTIFFPFGNYILKSIQQIFDVFSIIKLTYVLKNISPDIVVIDSPGLERGIMIIISLKLYHFIYKKIPKIISMLHNPHSFKFSGRRKIGLYSLRDLITQYFCKFYDRIIVLSNTCKLIAMNSFKIPRERLETIFFQVDMLNLIKKWAHKNEDNVGKLQKNLNKYTVTFIGRVDKSKGIDIFVNAIKTILRRYENEFEFLIVGNGPYMKKLQKITKKLPNIKILNWIEEIKEVYLVSDLIILPSFTEGVPKVIFEALSNFRPIICSKVGGVEDFLPSEWLIERGNLQEVVDKIIFFKNKKTRKIEKEILSVKEKIFSMLKEENPVQKFYNIIEK